MDAKQPTLNELIDALPAGMDEGGEHGVSAQAELQRLLSGIGSKPIPTGRLGRMWSLGTLQAKIVAAYVAWWLRTGFKDADAKRRGLEETHVATAIQVLGRMSYLRGAVMKLGQIIAHWPHVLPNSFASVLSRLYMDAPPMHFALLREHVQRELGAPPEEIFDEFETEACAAASLGQVHRAKLKQTGLAVAVKVQYPGIAKTIQADVRNLKTSGFAMRFSGDWDNMLQQYEGIEGMLAKETNYEQEALFQGAARETLIELDDVIVPKVVAEHSTRRILTSEFVDGVHLDEFLATNPSQELRDKHGAQILRATLRMWYSGRMIYADPHPGNFLFLADGKLGLLDFGCCHEFNDEEFEYVMEVENASRSGDREREAKALARGCVLEVEDFTPERLAMMQEYSDWLWEPLRVEGVFDFGQSGHFETGVKLYGEFIKRRWTRSHPVNVWLTKLFFGVRAMLTQMEARVEFNQIMTEERLRGTDQA